MSAAAPAAGMAPVRAAPRRRLGAGAYAMPLLAVMLVAFNLPILAMLAQSFLSPEPTVAHWAELVQTPMYLRVLGNTFWMAAITAGVCGLLGYPLAFWIRTLSGRAQLVALTLVLMPFWISVLVRTYAWIVVLGNAGMVNRALLGLGLVEAPVPFLYNTLGVTIGTTNVLLPFLVLPLLAAMMKLDERLFQAAATLGASQRAIFWRVFFPLTLPAFAAGILLVFILTLGFYVTPAILGGGRVPMIGNMLDVLINLMPRWELAAAISTLLLVATLGLFALYRVIGARGA
ncbi:ABC transporter permease [Roseomonas sp. 18066]|uniref:ABC transporter permease n=1 Tax=Roseomonas sp. 18066 TaxID=2681412 RepID=UPI00135BED46|nr:ABC transporter permease [Roseomonas sp. 18066]